MAGWNDNPADECWPITGQTIPSLDFFDVMEGRVRRAKWWWCRCLLDAGPECRRCMEYKCMHSGFTFIFKSGLSRFILVFLSTYFFFCLIFFLFIGKWASSILGGLCILLPSIRVHRSLYRNSIQPRRTFFSKMAPNLDFRRSRPRITIDLANQKPNLVNSYTTGDRIDGTATISVDHDIRFDDIDITFEGIYNSSN